MISSHFLKANGDIMNKKIITFGKALYSNTDLLKLTKIPLLLLALMLFVNVSLVSAPNFMGYMEGVEATQDLEGIDVAFTEMYETNLDCRVSEESEMLCEGDMQAMYGEYHFEYADTLDVSEIDESTIIFTPDEAAVIYQGDHTAVVSGNYSLLQGFDFSTIEDTATDSENIVGEFYKNNTSFFLENLYYSDMSQQIGIVYTVQFAQTFIYVIVVSLLIQMVNFRASIKKITYQAALRITILAMTGPALLSAILGFWIPGWAYLVFTMVYLIRIIVVYYSINRRSETLVGPKETPEIREETE